MKSNCYYDEILSQISTGKSLKESLLDLERQNEKKDKNRDIRKRENGLRFLVNFFATALVLKVNTDRGLKNLASTEIIPLVNELAKEYNVSTIFEQFRGMNTDKIVAANYEEELGLSDGVHSDKILKKIAKLAARLHIHLASIQNDLKSLQNISADEKIDRSVVKKSTSLDKGPAHLTIKQIKERLKYIVRRLEKVTLEEISCVPESSLGDIEKISKNNASLALAFERVAHHILVAAPLMTHKTIREIYNDYMDLRMSLEIPLSKKAKELIKNIQTL
jgi:hypothetical protein